MLVVQNNEIFLDWNRSMPVQRLNYAGEVVVVFDPSKTNMAMIVGTPTGQILNILEFSGNNRTRGPVMDTTQYCEEVRAFLRAYLQNVKLYMVCIEAAITKRGSGYHHSNMVLTEIRGNLLNFFKETFYMRPNEINNWSWKSAILPDGYRGRDIKGSKPFMRDYYPELGYHNYYAADVTDVVCMYWYTITRLCKDYTVYCNHSEICTEPYEYAIYPDWYNFSNLPQASFNEMFSFKENVDFYANRLLTAFCLETPISKLSREVIIGHAGPFTKDDILSEKCKVVIKRC